MDQLREQVTHRLEFGASLMEVDEELIARAPGLSEDEQAALWLYAWAYRSCQSRRSDRLSPSMEG